MAIEFDTDRLDSGRTDSWRAGFGSALTMSVLAVSILFPGLAVLSSFIIDDLGITRTQFGWIVTALAASAAILSPLVGAVADALGARAVAIAGLVIIGVAIEALAIAPTFVLAIAAAALGGLAKASTDPASNRLLMLHIEPGRRGLLMGFKQSGVNLGGVVAGFTLPIGAGAFGWRPTMAFVAVVALIAIALILRFVPPGGGRLPQKRTRAQRKYPATVWWLLGFAFFMGVAGSAFFTYLPLYAQERLSLTPTWAGLLAGLVAITSVLARILWSRGAEAMASYSRPLGVIAAVASSGMVLILVAPEIGWSVPVLVVGAVLAASLPGWSPLALLGIIRDAPAAAASASGALLLGMAGGGSIGPPLFGYSVDRTGSYVPGWTGAALALLAAATVARAWSRSIRSKEEGGSAQSASRGLMGKIAGVVRRLSLRC